jgi:hypothetical protein
MDATVLARAHWRNRLPGLFGFGLTTCLLAAVVAAQVASPGAVKAADPEDELKAATVLAFLQNAKWPDSETGGAHVTLGVLGRPAFFQLLRRTIEGKPVGGRLVRVVEVRQPVDPHCCQALYIASDRRVESQQALAGAAAGHMLTIGEANRFLDDGGAISVFLVDGHMAFEVSMTALGQCRVAISSKLLRFGRVRDLVKQRGPG